MILISPTDKTLIKSQSYANILQHHSTILWMCFTCSFRNTVIYWYIKMADKRVTTVKTLKKWKEEFKFDYDLCDRKMNTIRCQLCLTWDSRTKTWKNFSRVWVSPGSESKDWRSIQSLCSIVNHINFNRIVI